jgi:hypothetical protein
MPVASVSPDVSNWDAFGAAALVSGKPASPEATYFSLYFGVRV